MEDKNKMDNFNGEAFCNIVTKRYVIGVKTGRVIFLDKTTKKRLDPIMGFHHLVTGMLFGFDR